MKRDWSATRQAEENIAVREINTSQQKRINAYKDDIKQLDVIMSDLNEVEEGDSDIITALSLLAGVQARLKRNLFKYQKDL